MTLREVSISLEQISLRTHNHSAFNAQLHGIKLPFKSGPSDNSNIETSKEEKVKIEKLMSQALERRKWQKKN